MRLGICFVVRNPVTAAYDRGSAAATSSGDVSHHSWGAALDVNVATNWLGRPPHQDPRLVAAFVRRGFVWGGRFLVPDGMHFEYDCPRRFGVEETIPVPWPPPEPALCRA